MRRLLVPALIAALIVALAPVGHTDEDKLSIVRVPVTSAAQALYLETNFDETHNHGAGEVELLLWPGDAARLTAQGFDYRVVVPDVVARDEALFAGDHSVVRLPGPDRIDYRHLVDYVSEMQALAKKNPGLVRLIEMPHPTLEGRTVYGVEIAADVKDVDGRPVFYVDGVHHAREWPAAEYPMIFAHWLVEHYGHDPKVTSLLQRERVVVVPIVNVDGFDYSRESPLQASTLGTGNGFEGYWRKNRRSLSGVTVPLAQKNPDAYGVDPNRNYGFMWGDDIGGSSGDVTDQTYRGAAPFSEPETENVREFVLSHPITGLVTNHTYGDLVLRPWGHTAMDAADENTLAGLGARMARAMGGYTNEKGLGLYATTGTTDDWSYSATAGFGFTFEHGQAFHPPYDSEVGTSWRGVVRAFTILGEAAADPRYHSVVTGRVVDRKGNPVRARLVIEKNFRTPLWEGNPTGRSSIRERIDIRSATTPNGRFELHLNPSTRPLQALAGRSEAYSLVVKLRRGKGCSEERRIPLEIDRGQRLELGTISVRNEFVCVAVMDASRGDHP